jgi:dolichol-phosphate mannosyltransferase
MSEKFLLVIPTLNECENISRIFKKIKKTNKFANLLFIDDNSDDGSQEVITELSKKNKKVDYIFRHKKLGIGSAHKLGIKFAKKKNYRYVCTMDCDGAHDPAYIGSMFKLIRSSEIVITNRFLIKNALSGWKLRRIIITKLRYYLIRIFLNSKLDGSGGFRLYDLKKIKLNDILEASDDNYSFFWESIFLLEKKYKITEIPIKLQARVTGSSKMETKDIFDGFILLLKIFIKHRLRIF